jgi:hypothetical protein
LNRYSITADGFDSVRHLNYTARKLVVTIVQGARRHDDLCALSRISVGDRLSNATTGSRNQGDLPR